MLSTECDIYNGGYLECDLHINFELVKAILIITQNIATLLM